MPSQKKIDLMEHYSDLLKEHQDFIVTQYQGVNVENISKLRRELHKANAPYRVVKNNIFKRALGTREDIKDFPADEVLIGPIGVAFIRESGPAVAKTLKEFSGSHETFKVISGVMEAKYYDAAGIQEIADMPTREESLAQFAGALNTPARNIASLMNQVISSLARAIKAVGEKNG